MWRRTIFTPLLTPSGLIQETTYFSNENIKTQSDFHLLNNINYKVSTFNYDITNGHLTSKISSNGEYVAFTYWPNGKRKSATRHTITGDVTTTYTYDNLGRMSQVNGIVGTINYGYDPVGNCTSIQTPSGQTSYSYDADNLLQYVYHAGGGVTTYSYDDASKLIQLSRPNGIATTYNYDDNDHVTDVNNSKGSTLLSSYHYTLSSKGKRQSVTDATGTTQYTYDAASRLTQESGPSRTIQYTLDPVGNRTKKTSPTQSVVYKFDANDRIVQITPSTTGVAVPYSYDANGNVIQEGGPAATYDFENHLISTGATSFAYDADGNRISQTVTNGGIQNTINYLVDANVDHSRVLEERQNGGLLARYDYGSTLLRMDRGGTYYYIYDGLGSTRQLTDTNGNITDGYLYDAFGNPTRTGGNATPTVNSFLFTGQQFDVGTGLYYLRARYYQPLDGTFISQDPFAGVEEDPSTLQRYRYAGNDPVNIFDPSGEFDNIIGFLVTTSIGQNLQTGKARGDYRVYKFARDAIENGIQAAVEGQIEGFLQAVTGPISPFTRVFDGKDEEQYREIAKWLTADLPKENAEEFFVKLRDFAGITQYGDKFAGQVTLGHLYLPDEGVVLLERNMSASQISKKYRNVSWLERILEIAVDNSAWLNTAGQQAIHCEGMLAGKAEAYGLSSRRAVLTIDKPFCAECDPEGEIQMVKKIFKGVVLDELVVRTRTTSSAIAGAGEFVEKVYQMR